MIFLKYHPKLGHYFFKFLAQSEDLSISSFFSTLSWFFFNFEMWDVSVSLSFFQLFLTIKYFFS